MQHISILIRMHSVFSHLTEVILPRKLGKTGLHENASPFFAFLELRNSPYLWEIIYWTQMVKTTESYRNETSDCLWGSHCSKMLIFKTLFIEFSSIRPTIVLLICNLAVEVNSSVEREITIKGTAILGETVICDSFWLTSPASQKSVRMIGREALDDWRVSVRVSYVWGLYLVSLTIRGDGSLTFVFTCECFMTSQTKC